MEAAHLLDGKRAGDGVGAGPILAAYEHDLEAQASAASTRAPTLCVMTRASRSGST